MIIPRAREQPPCRRHQRLKEQKSGQAAQQGKGPGNVFQPMAPVRAARPPPRRGVLAFYHLSFMLKLVTMAGIQAFVPPVAFRSATLRNNPRALSDQT
jgi:hypothetical protein